MDTAFHLTVLERRKDFTPLVLMGESLISLNVSIVF